VISPERSAPQVDAGVARDSDVLSEGRVVHVEALPNVVRFLLLFRAKSAAYAMVAMAKKLEPCGGTNGQEQDPSTS
jgi:hypothetical protein